MSIPAAVRLELCVTAPYGLSEWCEDGTHTMEGRFVCGSSRLQMIDEVLDIDMLLEF